MKKDRIQRIDLVKNKNDFNKVLAVIEEYGIEILYTFEPRIYKESFGWPWNRKTYITEFVTLIVLKKDKDQDVHEPLREAVNRGLCIC